MAPATPEAKAPPSDPGPGPRHEHSGAIRKDRPSARPRLARGIEEWAARRSDFTLLWTGSAISQVGAFGMSTAAPLMALMLTGSPIFVGWVLAVGTVPGLLLHLPAGLIADRVDRRRIMYVAQSVRLAAALLLALGLLMLGDMAKALLIVAAAVDGSAVAFYNVAETVAVRHVVSPETLRPAAGKNEARQQIAVLLGRPLGGALFALDRTLPFFFGALTGALSLLALNLIRSRDFKPIPEHPPDHSGTPRREGSGRVAERSGVGIRDGLRFIVRDRFLRSTLGACTLANFLFQTVMVLLVVLAKQEGLSNSMIGLLLALSGLGGLLGSLLAPWTLRHFGAKIVVICCGALWLVLVYAVALSNDAIFGLIAWGMCGLIGAHVNVALGTYQMTKVPAHMQGLVVGLNRFLTTGAVPVGALCAGYIVAALDSDGAALLAAAGFTVVAVAIPLMMASSRLFRTSPLRGVPTALPRGSDAPMADSGHR